MVHRGGDTHGKGGHIFGSPQGWFEEEDQGGPEGDANVPFIEVGEMVDMLGWFCPQEGWTKWKFLSICLVPDCPTVDILETVDQEGHGDKGTSIGGHPGGLCWVDSSELLEFLVEVVLVDGVHPCLECGLSQQEPV